MTGAPGVRVGSGARWKMRSVAAMIVLVSVVASSLVLPQPEEDDSIGPIEEQPIADSDMPAMTTSVAAGGEPNMIDWGLHWGPIWYQDYGGHRDDFRKFNYDGDWAGVDNWDDMDSGDFRSYVYFSYVETGSDVYLGYYDYHARDWYHAGYSDTFTHENDLEGALLMVRKTGGYGTLVCMVTIAHDDFYQYAAVPWVGPGSRSVNGLVEWEEYQGSGHPSLYVESGGHGLYGRLIDRHAFTGIWQPGYLSDPDVTVRYVPTGVAETVSDRSGMSVGYALIPIDDPVEGLWQWRFGPYSPRDGWGYPFHDFSHFRGNDGSENDAKPPWGQDQKWKQQDFREPNDGPTFAGDIFYNPAQLVRTLFTFHDVLVEREYWYNPYVISLLIRTYVVNWDRDPKGDNSDAYLKIKMFDGEGRTEWFGHWNELGFFDFWDGVMDADSGTQASRIWWGKKPGTVLDVYVHLYGMRRDGAGLIYFGVESRDWDTWSGDEWLMGTKTKNGYAEEDYVHWYGSASGVGEGWNWLDWGGSAIGFYLGGDLCDDDSYPPVFSESKYYPPRLYVNDPRTVDFNVVAGDYSGLSSVRFRMAPERGEWTPWRTAAYCGPAGQDLWEYTVSVSRSEWMSYEGSRIQYQWEATDADCDVPGDQLSGVSEVQIGPYVGGCTPTGTNPSISGDLIAFQTYEPMADADLNGDNDTDDTVIRYTSMVTGTVWNTGLVGSDPSTNGKLIAFVSDGQYPNEVISQYNISSGEVVNSSWNVTLAAPSLSTDILAFEMHESFPGGSSQDMNGDYDLTDVLVFRIDPRSPFRSVVVADGEQPDVDGNIIVFQTQESLCGQDLNYDHDTNDTVIRYFNEESHILHNTAQVGERPKVSGNNIVFQVDEYSLQEDVNGDGLKTSVFVYMYNITAGSTTCISTSGRNPAVSGDIIVFNSARIVRWMGGIYPWQGFPIRSLELMKYSITTCEVEQTGDFGACPDVDRDTVAYGISEHSIGLMASLSNKTNDLNNDGDQSDDFIMYRYFGKQLIMRPLLVAAPSTLMELRLSATVFRVAMPPVRSNGSLSIEERQVSMPPPLPTKGMVVIGQAVEFATTAELDGLVTVNVSYDPMKVFNEDNLRLMKFDNSTNRWIDITTEIDTENNVVRTAITDTGAMISLMEWKGIGKPTDIGIGEQPSADNDFVAYTCDESSILVDLNLDNDMVDKILQIYDPATGITTNTGIAGYNASVSGRKVAFEFLDSSSGMTYVGCFDPDAVVSAEPDDDTSTSNLTEPIDNTRVIRTISPGSSPSIVGSVIAFETLETWAGRDLDYDGIQPEPIIASFDLNTDQITYIAAGTNPVSAPPYVLYLLSESNFNFDYNKDYDQKDMILAVYNSTNGVIMNTMCSVSSLSNTTDNNYRIAYSTTESEAGPNWDVNNDGDRNDIVILYYDFLDRMLYSTGAVGLAPSISGDVIAFCVMESQLGKDLIADGRLDDSLLMYYKISEARVMYTGEAATEVSVIGNTIVYSSPERMSGQDLNGDGDVTDVVVRFASVAPPPEASSPELVVDYVSRMAGGVVTNFQNTVSVRIPAGSLTSDATVQLERVPVEVCSAYITSNAESIVGTAQVLGVGSTVQTLIQPVLITMNYDESRVDESNTQRMQVLTSPDKMTWTPVTNCSVDTVQNTVSFRVNHFSYFVIMLDSRAPVTEIVPAGTLPGDLVSRDTTFELASTDDMSGVYSSYYRVDSGQACPYVSPFTLNCQGGQHSIEYWSQDNAGNLEAAKSLVVMLNGALITYTGSTSCDYSDSTEVSASFVDGITLAPLVGTPVDFTIGNQTVLGITDAEGVARAALRLDQFSGEYAVSADLSEDVDYPSTPCSSSFVISKEYATLVYCGDIVVPTTSEISLAAVVSDSADSSPGDIARATVTFSVYSPSDLTVPVQLIGPVSVIPSAPGTGIATATLGILPESCYLVIAEINQTNPYYTGRPAVPVQLFGMLPTDAALDVNDDGAMEYLAVYLDLAVALPGVYNVTGELSVNGSVIDHAWAQTFLEAGYSNVTIRFSGPAIKHAMRDGSYTVWLELRNESGVLWSNQHTTNTYRWVYFARPPVAAILAVEEPSKTGTVYTFNASGSLVDAQYYEVRWDFESDGVWDTDWTTNATILHEFPGTGNYTVSVEIRDERGLTDMSTVDIIVTPPDKTVTDAGHFPFVVVAMIGVTVIAVAGAIFFVLRSKRLKSP